MASSQGMLEGYRVLDFTQMVAGPTCTRILAEMGAEVIKLELAPDGDRVRAGGLKPLTAEFKNSTTSTYYLQHNHSKLSFAIDLKQPEARSLVMSMLPKIDVVVENFAPGVIKRLGFAYEDVQKTNPKIIMASISMAGQTGSLSYKAGYDYIGQAYAGVTDGIGERDMAPSLVTMAIGDVSTGVAAAMAVGFALLHRERTGEGQYLDASLIDTYYHMHETSPPMVALRGHKYRKTRNGSQHPDGGPTGVYHFKDDQYIVLTIPTGHQWRAFTRAVGMPQLADDPRFKSGRGRRDNGLELKVIAAVAVGGASITGGAATITGTVLGVILLGSIGTALTFLGVSAYWEKAIQGAIILGAIAINAITNKREKNAPRIEVLAS